MTPKKSSSTNRGPFGFTTRDIILLSLLVIGLIVGLIPAYQLAQRQQEVAVPSPTPSAQEIAQATDNQPSETPIPSLIAEPNQIATPLPPTPPPTNTPTQEPTVTPTMIPTSTPTTKPTPTDTPSSEPTSTTEPTAEATVEPTVEATTEPTVEATAEPTVEQATEPAVEATTELPAESPSKPATKPTEKVVIEPAIIVYVKIIDDTHILSLVTSTGIPIIEDLQRYALAPAWSPDGTEIVFFGEPGIQNLGGVFAQGEGIWTINPDTKVARQICRKNDVKSIAWSPDGSKLAYEFEEVDGRRKVLVVDSGDCANGKLYSGYDGQQPAWKNSSELAIRVTVPDSRGPAGLRLVNINNDNQTQLTTKEVDGFPSWSSDGQYLVFERQSNNPDIFLIKWDGLNWEMSALVTHPGKDTTPAFGPDNKEIYFLSDDSGKWQVKAVSLDGKNEYVIAEDVGSIDDWGLARPSVR